MMWDEYMREMLRYRDLLRNQGEMSMVNPRFHAWRERQIRRCNDELRELAPSITHPIIAFELSEGCTVGCWFCGLSADRFKGYYEYSEEHGELWRGVVGVASEMFGSAARTGFCYWATGPIDNPDYDCFLSDYHQITGCIATNDDGRPAQGSGTHQARARAVQTLRWRDESFLRAKHEPSQSDSRGVFARGPDGGRTHPAGQGGADRKGFHRACTRAEGEAQGRQQR